MDGDYNEGFWQSYAAHFGIAEDNYLSTDADEYEINNKLARERKFSEKSK